MDFINLPRAEYIKINELILKIKECSMSEYFSICRLLQGTAQSLPFRLKELFSIFNSWAKNGTQESYTRNEIELIMKAFHLVNTPANCIIPPENKKSELTEIYLHDGVFTRIIDIVSNEYGISPIEIFNSFSIRQLLIYYALIYNRKIKQFASKDKEKPDLIVIPGIGQEVAELPRKFKIEYYTNKHKNINNKI